MQYIRQGRQRRGSVEKARHMTEENCGGCAANRQTANETDMRRTSGFTREGVRTRGGHHQEAHQRRIGYPDGLSASAIAN